MVTNDHYFDIIQLNKIAQTSCIKNMLLIKKTFKDIKLGTSSYLGQIKNNSCFFVNNMLFTFYLTVKCKHTVNKINRINVKTNGSLTSFLTKWFNGKI